MKLQRLICAVMIFGICSLSLMISAAEKAAGTAEKSAKAAPASKAGAGVADIRETARSKALQIQKAIVTVRTSTKIITPGARRGQNPVQEGPKSEAIGIVIDPSGLTVTSNSSSSYMDMMEREMAMEGMGPMGGIGGAGGMGGMRGGGMPSMAKPQIVKETVIVYSDGSEEPGDVAETNEELGLTFVRPRATRNFDAISLKPRDQQPRILDSIFTVGRLGKGDSYALAVSLDSIRAVIAKKSNSYYISEKGSAGYIVFSADGEPIGICAAKETPKDSAGDPEMDGYDMEMAMMSAALGGGSGGGAIIRPTNDIIEAAKKVTTKGQAPEKPKSKEK
jgi:hypothetical protein